MDWESLRNLFLQMLEDELENWDKDFEKLTEEIINKLKQQGYEITPEIEKQLNDFALEKILQTTDLIKQVATITTGKSLKDPLIDEVVKEVFNYRYPDGLNLSERLWDWSSGLKHQLKQNLQTLLTKGRSADAIVYQLQGIINKYQGKDKAIVLKEKLPKWTKELEDLARFAIKNPKAKKEFEKKIKQFENYVEKLSKEGSYYRSKQLLNQIKKAVEEGKEYLINNAIKHHIYNKQLTRLKTIARTESANAYHKAQIKITKQDEDLIGYKWKLSSSHPKPDICDYLANVDYGYGKGIHPKDKVPQQKAHPNCMCYLIPVYDWEIKGKEKQQPKIDEKVLERFAPKYVKEFTEAGYDIKDLFSEREKRFLKKEEAMEKFGEDEFSLIQKKIERKFLQNLKKIENVESKEEFLRVFPELWERKKSFKMHVKRRMELKHIPEKDPELFYAKKIIEVLKNHNKVLIEKKGKINYIESEDWIVVITQKGKLKTAFKFDMPLHKWKESHNFKGKDEVEKDASREIKDLSERIWSRIKVF